MRTYEPLPATLGMASSACNPDCPTQQWIRLSLCLTPHTVTVMQHYSPRAPMATECASTLRCPQLSASSLQDEGGSPTKAHSTRARQEQEALLPGDMMLLASRRLCSARNQGANSPGPSARPGIHTQPLLSTPQCLAPLASADCVSRAPAPRPPPHRSPSGGRTARSARAVLRP